MNGKLCIKCLTICFLQNSDELELAQFKTEEKYYENLLKRSDDALKTAIEKRKEISTERLSLMEQCSSLEQTEDRSEIDQKIRDLAKQIKSFDENIRQCLERKREARNLLEV